MVKPFLKWAGGKGQLLNEILNRVPCNFDKYCEPFLGGGVVALNILNTHELDAALLTDLNSELINTYRCLLHDFEYLESLLTSLKIAYEVAEDKEKCYYECRDTFNKLRLNHQAPVERAALFIFLNKTCFNGLYRVNKDGIFNVPVGKYKNPKIFSVVDLLVIRGILENATITAAEFEFCEGFIDEKTFVYLDPPYRPINKNSFTAYQESGFNDENQKALADFCRRIDAKGGKFLLSNSDPHNTDPEDNFFDDLYKGFKIERIQAKRSINRDGSKRGNVTELLIRNYDE